MQTVQDRVRVGRTPAELKQAILDNLYYVQGRVPELATTNDWYMALAYTVRDRMMNDWIEAFARARKMPLKGVGYLSAEFLIGSLLSATAFAMSSGSSTRTNMMAGSWRRPTNGSAWGILGKSRGRKFAITSAAADTPSDITMSRDASGCTGLLNKWSKAAPTTSR